MRTPLLNPMFGYHRQGVIGNKTGCCLFWKVCIISFRVDIGIGNPIFQVFDVLVVSPKKLQSLGISCSTIIEITIVNWRLGIVFHQIIIAFIINFSFKNLLVFGEFIAQNIVLRFFGLQIGGVFQVIVFWCLFECPVSH